MKLSVILLLATLYFLPSQAQTVNKTDVHDIVATLGNQLTNLYPFPEISAKYQAALQKNETAGKYNNLTASDLAEHLTADLQQTHKDVHLHVFRDSSMYKNLTHPEPGGAQETDEQTHLRKGGYGIRSVELDPFTSTAYINVPGPFTASQESFEMAAAAMNMAAYSKYVILDLRANPGGTGEMGRFLASYFYNAGNEQFYLNGFFKDRGKDVQEWTYSYVPGKRMPDAKLYLLTGRGTGSASEGFAYAMQKLQRATIVGDTTAGAGIAGTFMPLKSELVVFLPFKMVVAPGTTTGWEGTGVIPDVETGKEDALAAVRRLIYTEVEKSATAPAEKAIAQWMVEDSALTAATPLTTTDIVGKYTNNISIVLSNGQLQWIKAEPGKPVLTFVMKEIKKDVFTIIDLNKDYGANSSRMYVNRDDQGHVKSLTRKVLVLIGDGSIHTVPASYTPISSPSSSAHHD